GVWDRLRFNPDADRPEKATILVIGQQFKWNVVYPGKDGKLGRYLLFPKPTDARWPGGIKYANVTGPNKLPYAQAVKTINTYIDQLTRSFAVAKPPQMNIVIAKDSPGAVKNATKEEYLYVEDPKEPKPKTIIRNNQPLTAERVANLKKAGITSVVAFESGTWE